jgi:thiol:disulfide interchange protein
MRTKHQQIMKTNLTPMALCLGLLFTLAPWPTRLYADDSGKAKPKIYDETADGNKQVAVAMAEKEHKRILLQFGANWCGWCHKLHQLCETDKTISAALKAGYVVAMIDVDKGHNKDLVAKFGAEHGYGLPFLVVLDSDGKHLLTKHSDDLEEGDHHSPQKVLAFLKEWAPKR